MRDLVREISRNLLGEFEDPSDPEWPTGKNATVDGHDEVGPVAI